MRRTSLVLILTICAGLPACRSERSSTVSKGTGPHPSTPTPPVTPATQPTTNASIFRESERSPRLKQVIAKAGDEARRDIAAGRLELRTFGLMSFSREHFEYVKLLKDRLGVEEKPVAGCIVTDELIEGVRAYNSVVRAEIDRRFGLDAMDKLHDEALGKDAAR